MTNSHFAQLRRLIDKKLNAYLPKEDEEPKALHKAMRYSVFSGGKRLRSILSIEVARACGGRTKDILPIACAIELIHTYSLIHDDLPSMDDDDYRRGKLTCHKVFGEANAILAGDALLTLAFNIISKEVNERIGLKVMRELTDAIGTKGMVGGQALDLVFFAKKVGTKEEKGKVLALNRINRLKTSRLFESSAKLGAMMAGLSEDEVNLMSKFGACVGLAFQIVDDIIDNGSYSKMLGMTRSHHDSKILTEKAKRFLRPFGRSASRLKEIADYVINRSA